MTNYNLHISFHMVDIPLIKLLPKNFVSPLSRENSNLSSRVRVRIATTHAHRQKDCTNVNTATHTAETNKHKPYCDAAVCSTLLSRVMKLFFGKTKHNINKLPKVTAHRHHSNQQQQLYATRALPLSLSLRYNQQGKKGRNSPFTFL